MKRRIKKGIVNLLLAATIAVGAAATVSTFLTQENADYASAVENTEQLSQTIDADYDSSYAVGETVYLYNYEISVDGQAQKTSAVLQKDYTVYASLSVAEESLAYKFTEAGAYQLIYLYTDAQGRQTVVNSVHFDVRTDIPYMSIAFEKEYMRNSEISIDAKCFLQESSAVPTVKVVSPLGEEISAKTGSFVADVNGVYTITYAATLGGAPFEKTYHIKVTSVGETYKDYILPVSGVSAVKDNAESPEWAIQGKGVEVSLRNFGAFRFNNVIDLNALSKGDDLIKMLPLGDGEYQAVQNFKIKLIDAYDETNAIEYEFYPRHYSFTWDSGWTYCNVKYKDTTYSVNDNGTVNLNSFYGILTSPICNPALLKEQVAGGIYYGYSPWVRCQADYAEKEFYVYAGRYVHSKQKLVVDLDEPKHVGYGNEWQGFTTGEVYLEVEITSTASASGCIVQEVAGQKLYGEIEDNGAPYFGFDTEENGTLPSGVVKTFYPFPAVDYATDIIEGKTYSPAYTVTKIEREIAKDYIYEDVELTSQSGFVPSKTGNYRITYEVADGNGNVGVRQLVISVKESLGTKGVAYALPETLYVGETITVPTLTPTGMSTLIKREESVTYNGVDYAARAGEALFLDAAGTLVVKCSYKDHLGQTYELNESYAVTASTEAITSVHGVVPQYVLKGRTIVLPSYTAIDYSKEKGSAGYNVPWTLTVDGEEVNAKTRSVTVNKEHGESVEVVYSVNGVAKERYEMTVVDGKYLSDRFYTTSGTIEKGDEENYVELNATTNAESECIFPFTIDVNAPTFPLIFNVEASAIAFESIDVYFEDYVNEQESVFIRLRQTSSGLLAQVNGTGTSFSLNKAESYDGYTFEYNRTFHSFQFTDKVIVLENAQGEPFDGFSSDQVKVRFVFNGVRQETKLRIYKIGTISCLSYFEKGQLVEYVDTMFPLLIWSNGSYQANDFVYGKEITLPGVEFKTPLSGEFAGTLAIVSPTGNKIVENHNAYDAYTLTLDEYGTYQMTYTVKYARGTRKYRYTFRVNKEEVPVIELTETWTEGYKIGDTFTLPKIAVTGAAADYTVDYFLVTPSGTTSFCEEKTTLNEYGTYEFRVMVTDEYNVVTTTWRFTVEG